MPGKNPARNIRSEARGEITILPDAQEDMRVVSQLAGTELTDVYNVDIARVSPACLEQKE
jgi:hypothetical protein